MRGKGILSLVEQSAMMLIFAVATAMCLRGFLAAELVSRKNAALDDAVLQARDVAEQLKYTKGEWEAESLPDDYNVTIRYLDSEIRGLGRAEVVVTDDEGAVLFLLPVAWQEVDGNET